MSESTGAMTPGLATGDEGLRTFARATRRHGREVAVGAAYAALLLALAVFRPAFYERQFFDTLVSAAPVLVVACGMTLVILCRHIDISVGSQVSVCAVLAALAAREGVPMPLVALVAVGAGALFGCLNGWLVAGCGLPSIVVTLATMVMIYEPLRWAREGEAVRGLPETFQWFGLSQSQGEWLLIAVAATVLILLLLVTRYVAAGRAVYAVGSDPEAARLAGIRSRRVVFVVYVLAGALAGLAALMQAVRQPQVDVVAGLGLELEVIAAVVVGGAAITGGRGTLVGTLLGVALLGAVRPALGFLGLQAEWERAVHGLIILLAVASEGLFRRRTR
jgi:rhamnose transport system permease protein